MPDSAKQLMTQVINLDGSEARWQAISGALDSAGIPYARFAAVDARQSQPTDFPDYDDAEARHVLGRPMTGGEIGCYLSHMGAVRKFLESDRAFGLVFEDDATVTEAGAARLRAYLDFLATRDDWHVVNLGQAPRRFCREIDGGTAPGLCRSYYHPIMATAVLWSRRGAAAFVENHTRITEPVDIEIRKLVGASGRGLAARPALFPARAGESTIDDGRKSKRRSKTRTAGYRLRTISRRIRENAEALAGWVSARGAQR